jgi:hypothetical protein
MIGHSGNEVGEKLAYSGVSVVSAQIHSTAIDTGRVIGGVPESRAPSVWILRKINRHGSPQSTDGGGGGGGMRRASACRIGLPLFAYRSRMVARPHSTAVSAASTRNNAI